MERQFSGLLKATIERVESPEELALTERYSCVNFPCILPSAMSVMHCPAAILIEELLS